MVKKGGISRESRVSSSCLRFSRGATRNTLQYSITCKTYIYTLASLSLKWMSFNENAFFLFYVKLMLSFGTNENYDEQKSSMTEKIESGEQNCDIKLFTFILTRSANKILLKIASFMHSHSLKNSLFALL